MSYFFPKYEEMKQLVVGIDNIYMSIQERHIFQTSSPRLYCERPSFPFKPGSIKTCQVTR